MAFFNEFPYSRTYDSDLGWLIRHVKKLSASLYEFIDANSITIADPIEWSIATQYPPYTVVIDGDGNAYLSRKAVPEGVTLDNEEYWQNIYLNVKQTRTVYYPWVNVKELGLLGDGSDESETLTRILEDNKFLWFPSGTYNFEEVDISNAHLKTSDAVISPMHDAYGNFCTIFTGQNFTLDGFVFRDGTIPTDDNPILERSTIYAYGKNVEIKNCTFKDFYARRTKTETDVTTMGYQRGCIAIHGTDVKSINIHDCVFDTLIGAQEIVTICTSRNGYEHVEDIIFKNNHVVNINTTELSGHEFAAPSFNFFGKNVVVQGNDISNRHGRYSMFNIRATHLLIDANHIENSSTDIIFDMMEVCIAGANKAIITNNIIDCKDAFFIDSRGGDFIVVDNQVKTKGFMRWEFAKLDSPQFETSGAYPWRNITSAGDVINGNSIIVKNNVIEFGYMDNRYTAISCAIFMSSAEIFATILTSIDTEYSVKIEGNVFKQIASSLYDEGTRREIIGISTAAKDVSIKNNEFNYLPDTQFASSRSFIAVIYKILTYAMRSLDISENKIKDGAQSVFRPVKIQPATTQASGTIAINTLIARENVYKGSIAPTVSEEIPLASGGLKAAMLITDTRPASAAAASSNAVYSGLTQVY